MSNQDLVLGFKLSTLWLWVSFYNHKTDAPSLKRSNFFVGFEPVAVLHCCPKAFLTTKTANLETITVTMFLRLASFQEKTIEMYLLKKSTIPGILLDNFCLFLITQLKYKLVKA